MKTAAVIAEYNPFHKGHLYHIEKTRRETGADFILAVMSGDFVQRGAPALTNKFNRTKMALSCGVDAVIELPALYALSSAEFFAGGAVALLDALHVVDVLSFGSEAGEISLFEECASMLVHNHEEISCRTRELLKKGCSYPAARLQALSSDEGSRFSPLFSSPNNILGLEYCKALYALNSTIRPFTFSRRDRGYHDTSLGETPSCLSSASAIRRALAHEPGAVKNHVPEHVYEILREMRLLTRPVTEDSFSQLLYYKLLMEKEQGFAGYLDCTKDLSDKICKNLPRFTTFTGFVRLLKSKELTYTRISRVLMHILLDIKKQEAFLPDFTRRKLPVPYARLLGFRKEASVLLKAIRQNSAIPLITRPAHARRLLAGDDYDMLMQDIRCGCVYESILPRPEVEPPLNEFSRPLERV